MKKINKKHLNKILITIIILMSYPVYTQVSAWLWKINGQEFSQETFKFDYNAYIELVAWQMGTNKDVLKQYIGNEEKIEDPKLKLLISQLNPKAFAENLINIQLMKAHAARSGYLNNTENKIKFEFLSEYLMMQIYLSELMAKEKIDITDDEAEKAWVEERKKSPNLQNVPIDRGIQYMKQKLAYEKAEENKNRFISSLREKNKVERNEKFNELIENIEKNSSGPKKVD